MPSFLSRVFGRKKDDKDKDTSPSQLSPGELLGGRFEAISPNTSPNVTKYLDLDPGSRVSPIDAVRSHEKEKEFGFAFFRSKSRPSSPEVKPKRLLDTLPALSLDFDGPNSKSTTNGHIFDELGAEVQLSDAVISRRRLKPQEALVLVRACSQAIVSRGLETLGIMTPHWYSASPDSQRALISKFLKPLDAQNPTVNSPLSPRASNFEDEVNFTRSVHDVAAVLRWGLRHLQVEGDSFGRDGGWYNAFFDAEAADDYPSRAFSEKLALILPASHFDLLAATLEIFSSLAAFSESNSTSGSKLSKIFGLWLLNARRVEDKDDWRTFYARWERAGRMLEHLFLARIRDQSADGRIPVRLLELVRKYPYTHGLSSPSVDLRLLPRPPSTTVLTDALYVRVEYELMAEVGVSKLKTDPSVFLADALSTKVLEGECVGLWNKITRAASKTGSEAPLNSVFANETVQLLSLVADKCKDDVKSPTFSLVSLPDYRCSLENPAPLAKSVGEPATAASPLSPINIGSDWEQFSTSGFLNANTSIPPLASTLLDTDIEKTVPPHQPASISRKSSKLTARRKSYEIPRSVVIAGSSGESSPEPIENLPSSEPQKVVKVSNPEITQLDESFFDFWSDALLDPISSDWPAFVVCKFKSTLVPELTFGSESERTLKWLILEQVCVKRLPPTPLPQLLPAEAAPRTSSSSVPQTPSGKRRFNFWSLSRTPSSSSTSSHKAKKAPKTPKVGEMGELVEEGESRRDITKVKDSKKRRSLDLSGRKKVADNKVEEKSTADPVPDTEDDKAKFIAPAGVAATGAIIAGAVSATADVQDTDGEQLVGGEHRLVAAFQEGPTLQDDTFAVEQPVILEQTAQDEAFLSRVGVALPPVAEESFNEGQGIEEVVEPEPEVINDELQPILVSSGDTSTDTERSIPTAIVDNSEVAAEVQLDETRVTLDGVADYNADVTQQEDFVEGSGQEGMTAEREEEFSGAVLQPEASGEVAVAVLADSEPFEDQPGLSIATVVEEHVTEQLLVQVDAEDATVHVEDVPAEVATHVLVEEKPSGPKVAVGVAEGAFALLGEATTTPVEDATEESLVAVEEIPTIPEATTLAPVQVAAEETPTIPEATQESVVELSPVVVEEAPAVQAESYIPESVAEFEKAPEVAKEVLTATEVIPAPITDSESLVAEVASTPAEISAESVAKEGPEGIVEDAPREDIPISVEAEHEEVTALSEGDPLATIEQGLLEEPGVAVQQLTPTVKVEITDLDTPSGPVEEVPVSEEAPVLVEEVAQIIEEIPADTASSEVPTTVETSSPPVDEVETVDESLTAEQPCVPIDEPPATLDEAPEVVEEVSPIVGEFPPLVEQATVVEEPPASPSRSEESPLVDGGEPRVIEQESTDIDGIVEDPIAVVERASTLAGEAPMVIGVESVVVEEEFPASETDTTLVGEPPVVSEETSEVIQTIGEDAQAPEEPPVIEESPAILEEMATPIQEPSTSAEQVVETDSGLSIDEKATEVVEGATDIHKEAPTMPEQSAADVGDPPAPIEDPAAGVEGISSVEEPTVVDDPPAIEDVPSALANELPIVEAVLVEEVDVPGLEGVDGEEPDFVTRDVAADAPVDPIEVPASGETAGDGSSHDVTVQLSSEVELPTVEVNNTTDDPQVKDEDPNVHEPLPPTVSISSPEFCVASSTNEPPSTSEPPPETNEPVVTVLNRDNDNVKLETDETTTIVKPVLAFETVHADVEMNEPVPNRSESVHEDLLVDVGRIETKEVEVTIMPKESAPIAEAP